MNSIPTTMPALVLPAYKPDLEAALRSLRVERRPIPPLTSSQVLVKIEAAPCNPSDLQTTIQRRADLTGAVEALL